MFWAASEDVTWQVQGEDYGWHDFQKDEVYLLERAWNNDEEEFTLPDWEEFAFYLPIQKGGTA